MNELEATRGMAPTRIPANLHKWLKLEAVHRDSTIEAQLTEAVLLLRQMREGDSSAYSHATDAAVQP